MPTPRRVLNSRGLASVNRREEPVGPAAEFREAEAFDKEGTGRSTRRRVSNSGGGGQRKPYWGAWWGRLRSPGSDSA